MATAYAACNSLMNLITQLKEHPQPPIILAKEHVVSLDSKISFFKNFLENHHNTIDHGLEMRIADAVHAAEDLIETCIADRLLAKNGFDEFIQRVVEELDLIGKEMTEMNQNEENQGGGISISVETAYAAVKSTMRVIEHVLEQPWALVMFYKKRADSLCAKIHVLMEFLEKHDSLDAKWVTQIDKGASDVQYSIDSHVERLNLTLKNFYGDLQRAIESMDLIEKKVTEMSQIEQSRGHNPHSKPLRPSPSLSATSGENIVIGIEDTVNQVMSKLTLLHKSGRMIISISGMGGIGKTTLAREVYNNPYIKNYFDVRAWAAISKDYNTRKSLEELLLCLDEKENKESLSKKEEHELGQKLYQHLFNRRYLIILDDVWDAIAWERLRSFFPDSSNSAIVITTRESTIASIGSQCFVVHVLDETKSWDLFCRKVFGQDSCPTELGEIGKEITNKCRGLPLAIVVIGGHLAKSTRTPEYWEYIANNLSSVTNAEESGHCLKVLYLSYAHLPVHLKPCFLYLAIFQEDEEIRVSRLIRLWMAEGFLEPIYCNNPEENARKHLDDLIGRNLISASELSIREKVSTCKIHDLLRDLCLKEALEKKFVHVAHDQDDMKVIKNGRRLVFSPSTVELENALRKSKALRTLIYKWKLSSMRGKLLRVLAPTTQFSHFDPEQHDMKYLVNVRYFHAVACFSKAYHLHSSMFLPWNLQHLFIEATQSKEAPPEIWEMSQLRTINVNDLIIIPHPPSIEVDIMKNLQSAKGIRNLDLCKEVVVRIPNIKKLAVTYDEEFEGCNEVWTLNNINRLEKLESLGCSLNDVGHVQRSYMLRDLTFPHTLRRLTFTCLHWDDVTSKIGSLPLLEILLLGRCSGHEWKLDDTQFVRLKLLSILHCRSLRRITADNSNFPCLQRLMLVSLPRLKKISTAIGDISTLKLLAVSNCPDSVVASAKDIADQQCDLGNDELQVKAHVRSDYSLLESTNNFIILYDSDDDDNDRRRRRRQRRRR